MKRRPKGNYNIPRQVSYEPQHFHFSLTFQNSNKHESFALV